MKISEKKIALIISAIATLGMFAAMLLMYSSEALDKQTKLTLLVVTPLVFGVSTYLILNRILKTVVLDQLKSIYTTLEKNFSEKEKNDTQILKTNNNESQENFNVVSHVNEEVTKWAKEKAEEISTLKSNEKYRKEYIGNVSHELKTPLFNIQGYISTLIDGGLDDPAVNAKYLERAEKNINRLISIVQELDTIAKLETGNLKLTFETFDIAETVKEVFEFYEMKAKSKDITLNTLIKANTPTITEGDKTRIYEVIANLVINSINYGKQGGTTTVGIFDIGQKWLVEVKDNGIGISEENVQRVFERFFRVDKSRSSQNGGTGLGLAIVKHILEAHGEGITVKSVLNEGTNFSFTLKKAKK